MYASGPILERYRPRVDPKILQTFVRDFNEAAKSEIKKHKQNKN